jgi:Fe-S-cluster containining protein
MDALIPENVLLPASAVWDVLARSAARVTAIPSDASPYRTLVELARIHQQAGEDMAALVSERTQSGRGPDLACKMGCSTCCRTVPSKLRGPDANYYMLTVLDIVTLVENYAAIKRRSPNLLERATAAIKTARDEGALAACPYLAAAGDCGIYDYRPVACKLWFSAELAHCLRHSAAGWRYPGSGIDPLDIASNSLREEAEAVVMPRAAAVLRGVPFGDYDYLTVFHALARFDGLGLFDTFRARIDAGDLARWEPFRAML